MSQDTKLGVCVLCGDRVFNSERHLKSSDGYCHRECITEKSVIA